MKNHAILSGSSAGLAAVVKLNTTVGFLLDREETIDLCPIMPTANGGYVWKRVYHRRCI